MNKSILMKIANSLVQEQKYSQSEALKLAWQMMKNGVSCKVASTTYGGRQSVLQHLQQVRNIYVQRENNRLRQNAAIVIINNIKIGYLSDAATTIVNTLIKCGVKFNTQLLKIIGGDQGKYYGARVGIRLV